MPKLSSPSFKVVIKSKPLSDGTYPVRLQSNWHGQSEVSLGISLSSPSDFDKVRQRVRKSVRNSAVFNRIIEQKLLIVNQDYMSKLSSGVTVFTHRVALIIKYNKFFGQTCNCTGSELICKCSYTKS